MADRLDGTSPMRSIACILTRPRRVAVNELLIRPTADRQAEPLSRLPEVRRF